MKRGGVKASGAITLITYLLLLILAVVNVLVVLPLEPVVNLIVGVPILAGIVGLINHIFVGLPLTLVGMFADLGDSTNLVILIVSIVFAVFCLYMFFWGIKEISLKKKDDYKFARCKKTCAFMHIIKFFLFLYYVAVIVCSFLVETYAASANSIADAMGVPYIVVIVAGVLAFLAFLTFVLAVANINKVAKALKNGEVYADPNANYADQNYAQNGYNQPQFAQQPMQGNAQPMNNGYNNQYAQPQYQQPQQPQYQQQYSNVGASGGIVPGQNGVPINITQKGIQDLERLERLKQSGAITDANYIVMRTKICNSNLG